MPDIRKVFAVAIAAFSAFAYSQQPPDAGSLLREQAPKQPSPISPDTAPVLPQVTPPKPALPPTTKVNVTVKDFRFTGNTVFPAEVLREQVREFVGKTLDFDGLNDAADRVRATTASAATSSPWPICRSRRSRTAWSRSAILEGRLGQIDLQVDPKVRLKESFARRILDAHLKPGDIITENSLERPLLLLHDLPTWKSLRSSGRARRVGAADLNVELAENRRPFNGYVDFDNHGNRFTGEYRLGLNVNSGNLTGYGDLLSFRGFLTDDSLMKFGRLSYIIPVGPYGTRVGVSGTAFEYELGKDFEALQSNGEGTVGTLYALHPILRTRNANLFVQAAVEQKDLEDRIDSVGSVEERTITAGKLGVVGDFRDRLLSGGLNSYSLTYTGGELDISPPAVEAADQAPGTGPQTSGSFSKVNLELRRLQRISDNFNLLLAYAAQLANKNLTAAEKMSLGGPNGVRAYPVGEAPGDTGQLGTVELRYIVPGFQVGGGDFTLSTFIDYGQVKTLQDPPPAAASLQNMRSIGGAGIGLSLGREGNFLVRANVAWRLDKDETPQSDPSAGDPLVWIQAIKWF